MNHSLFNTLHLIKVFAALLVVGTHYADHFFGVNFYSYGTGCFFIVTGYYALNWERTRGVHYILKRLIRLYPAYLVAVVAYIVSRPSTWDEWPTLLFHHLTFLLSTPDKATAFALNPPFWSLPVFFTFFVLVAFMPRITPRGWQVGALMLLALAVIQFSINEWRDGYVELLVLPLHLYAFWLGGWMGHRAHRDTIVASKAYSALALGLMAIVVVSGFYYQTLVFSLFEGEGFYYRVIMVLIHGALFWSVLHSHWVTRPSRVLAFLGTISFGIYLFHNLPLYWLYPHLGVGSLAAALAFSVLLAWGSWVMVEAPLLGFCKPRLARWMGEARQ
ncbi:acyltransferase family protein [Vreelandella sp. EE22]